MLRNEYISFRRRFEPNREDVKLVIIAESPPKSGKYFYKPNGLPTEPLFAEITRQLGFFPKTKEDGLLKLRQYGWVLVDATYKPVNGLQDSERSRIIKDDYPLLTADLKDLAPHCSTPVVLIKANVCRLLEARLIEDKFNVLNRGSAVYFPACGRQKKFREQFSAIIQSAGIQCS
jgi:hypothetical protein